MSLLLISEIRDCAAPSFGGDFAAHIADKANPGVRGASLTAWNLLALGLRRFGHESLPAVAFDPQGKPAFTDAPPHFSLAHSGGLAVALISEQPCGVDIEHIRPEVRERLWERCLSERERELDFFECWTKKECIGKLGGRGIGAHPARIDTLDPRWEGRFLARRIADSAGNAYALAALCEDANELSIQFIEPEAL